MGSMARFAEEQTPPEQQVNQTVTEQLPPNVGDPSRRYPVSSVDISVQITGTDEADTVLALDELSSAHGADTGQPVLVDVGRTQELNGLSDAGATVGVSLTVMSVGVAAAVAAALW